MFAAIGLNCSKGRVAVLGVAPTEWEANERVAEVDGPRFWEAMGGQPVYQVLPFHTDEAFTASLVCWLLDHDVRPDLLGNICSYTLEAVKRSQRDRCFREGMGEN